VNGIEKLLTTYNCDASAQFQMSVRVGSLPDPMVDGTALYQRAPRKVRLRDSHAAWRTMAEMKGAFDKQKAPLGVKAQFTFLFSGQPPKVLGAPDQGRTIHVDERKSGKLPKPRQLPNPGEV
jgi:hypothetical protein